MLRAICRVYSFCCLLLVSGLALSACAGIGVPSEVAPPQIAATAERLGLKMEARAAFGGAYRAASWLPVVVDLRNSGPDQLVEVRAATANSASYAARLALPNSANKSVTLFVYIPNIAQRVQVQLLVDGQQIERQTIRLQPYTGETQMVGLVSASGAGRRITDLAVDGPLLRAVGLTLADLPEQAEGLSSFDALVLDDVPTAELSAGQRAALEGWVARGGQLVVGGGAGAARSLEGLPEPLRIATVAQVETVAAPTLYGAAALAGQVSLAQLQPVEPFEDNAPPYGRTFEQLDAPGPGPLAYEQTFGKGGVTVLGLALSGIAFEGWPQQSRFWNELLWRPNLLPPGFAANTFTVDELINSNLAAALTSLPALEFPSLSLLGGLLLAYILLVGPVTYLLLRRFDRLALGWLVVPSLTVLFAGLTYSLGYAQRGGEVFFNQVTLIEPFAGGESGMARQRSFVGVFSPTQHTYTVDVVEPAGGPPLLRPISVQGPWDTNLAGQSGVFIQEQDSPPLSGARASELEIAQWSLRGLMTDRIGPYAELSAQVIVNGAELQGEVQNHSSRRLEGVAIVQGDRVARFGDLEPGERQSAPFRKQVNIGMNAASAPLSYLVYGDQIDASGQANGGPLPIEIQSRVRILDTIFSYGVMPRNGQPMLIAWGREPNLSVSLIEQRADQQALELITLSPKLLVESGQAHLDRGWLGQRVNVGQAALCFGNLVVGVNLGERPVITELSLPRDLAALQVDELTLIASADGPWPSGATLELYDWVARGWVSQPASQGTINVAKPTRFFGAQGWIRARFDSDQGGEVGCVYLDATLKGRMS